MENRQDWKFFLIFRKIDRNGPALMDRSFCPRHKIQASFNLSAQEVPQRPFEFRVAKSIPGCHYFFWLDACAGQQDLFSHLSEHHFYQRRRDRK